MTTAEESSLMQEHQFHFCTNMPAKRCSTIMSPHEAGESGTPVVLYNVLVRVGQGSDQVKLWGLGRLRAWGVLYGGRGCWGHAVDRRGFTFWRQTQEGLTRVTVHRNPRYTHTGSCGIALMSITPKVDSPAFLSQMKLLWSMGGIHTFCTT